MYPSIHAHILSAPFTPLSLSFNQDMLCARLELRTVKLNMASATAS